LFGKPTDYLVWISTEKRRKHDDKKEDKKKRKLEEKTDEIKL